MRGPVGPAFEARLGSGALVWITLVNLTAVLAAVVIIADWWPWGYVLATAFLLPFGALFGVWAVDRIHYGTLRKPIRLTED